MNKSAFFCIIDGLTDEGFTLNKLPSLAAMAQAGAYGFFDTMLPGFEVESYPCIAGLLGIGAADLPPLARGYVEAVGAGVLVGEDDLILRGSWLTLAADGTLGGPAPPPLNALTLPAGCEYYSLGGYKALLVLRGCAHMLQQIKTCPPHACVGQKLEAVLPAGEPRLAELVRLSQDQQRVLLPWGQSVRCQLPTLGYRAAAVGAAAVFAGLSLLMGFDFRTAAGFSGDINTDLSGKTRLVLELARQYPLVALHINGADEASHRCNALQKQDFLGRVNDFILQPLMEAGLPLLVTSDHGTDPLNGRHVGGLQPFVLTGTARRGDMGTLPATSALKLLVEEK